MAPTDVHGTLGGIYGCLRNLRGPMDGPKEPSSCRMTDFDGFLRIPTESGGSWRDFAEPLGLQVGVCADACPTSVRGILIFKWSGCLTICELCCVPTSCPVYCLVLPLPVSPPPQNSTSKICKPLPVMTSNVKNKSIKYEKTGFPQNGVFLFLIEEVSGGLSLLNRTSVIRGLTTTPLNLTRSQRNDNKISRQ